jgi:hypothetical protein
MIFVNCIPRHPGLRAATASSAGAKDAALRPAARASPADITRPCALHASFFIVQRTILRHPLGGSTEKSGLPARGPIRGPSAKPLQKQKLSERRFWHEAISKRLGGLAATRALRRDRLTPPMT